MRIELLSSDPAELDTLQAIRFPTLDNGPHLSYAVQWFIFTTFVVVGWVFAVRGHAREIGALPPKPRRGPPPNADEYW
jgi:cytochrome oxidase assembly protein ShyY1